MGVSHGRSQEGLDPEKKFLNHDKKVQFLTGSRPFWLRPWCEFETSLESMWEFSLEFWNKFLKILEIISWLMMDSQVALYSFCYQTKDQNDSFVDTCA
jgi:hypothetical protein